jgi:hypothetical protein
MTQVTILPKATGAANSDGFLVDSRALTVGIYPEANLGAEVATLQIQNPDGTWDDVYDENGVVQLGATRIQETIWGGGTFRLEFAARTLAIGAYVQGGPGGR